MKMRYRLLIMIVVMTILIGIPRFNHHTPDSIQYIKLAQYFRGILPRDQLLKPYALRILLPLIAAIIPITNLDINFALINIICTIISYILFVYYLNELGFKVVEINLGIILLVFSFPSFNYASGVLTDPMGFLLFVYACYCLLKNNYFLVALVASVGVLVRESLLTIVPIVLIDFFLSNHFTFQKKPKSKKYSFLIAIIFPILTFLILNSFFFSDIYNTFHWGLSIQGFMRNIINNKIGWITLPLTLCPLLLLFFYGLHYDGWNSILKSGYREKSLLLSITIISFTYIIYSLFIKTAFTSGRFVWPFYSALIPLTLLSIRNSPFFVKWFIPVSNKIFGN